MAIVPMQDAVPGNIASSAEYNKLIDNIEDLDSRLTAEASINADQDSTLSTLEANQGTRGTRGTIYGEIEDLDGRVTNLESSSGGGTAEPTTTADDTLLYGDTISNVPRRTAYFPEVLSNGYMTAVATRSTKTFTATAFRICCVGAMVDGYFDIAFYTGPSTSNLTKRAEFLNDDSLRSVGVKEFALPSIAIAEGDYVALWFGVISATTEPDLSSTWYGTNSQLLINSANDGSVYSTFDSSQSLPPPSEMNMADPTWTRASNQFWFSVV